MTIGKAQCPGYRDGRDKPGHDDASGESTAKYDNYSTGLHAIGNG